MGWQAPRKQKAIETWRQRRADQRAAKRVLRSIDRHAARLASVQWPRFPIGLTTYEVREIAREYEAVRGVFATPPAIALKVAGGA